MKRIFLSIIFLSQILSAGGFTVRNGGGLIENQFVFVWQGLSTFLKPCVVSSVCRLSTSESKLLQKILAGLISKSRPGLVFEIKNKNLVAVAKPEEAAFVFFDPITEVVYVDPFLLYEKNGDPFKYAGLERPTQMLTMALGMMHGASAELSLALAEKVSQNLRQVLNFQSLVNYGHSEVGIQLLKGPEEKVSLLVFDSTKVQDISKLVLSQMYCPSAQVLKVSNISDIYWEQVGVSSGKEVMAVLAGNISYKCQSGTDMQSWVGKFSLSLFFETEQGSAADYLRGRRDVEIKWRPNIDLQFTDLVHF